MSGTLDRRLNAYRNDLADKALEGRIDAARFVAGQPYHVAVTIAPLHPVPTHDADLDTQALFGETVRVFDIADGWAWCQLDGDHYVGYVPLDCLVPGAGPRPTHKVRSGAAFAYSEPTARSRPLRTLLFATPLTIINESGAFYELLDEGFVGRQHVELIDALQPDYLSSARTFLGAPYLWGGKSVLGIDCSGLVQLSLLRAGIDCPRDTDMQQKQLPGDIDITNDRLQELRRGDIVFWPRHVGLMLDNKQLLHANGTSMSTTIEAVRDVAARSKPITAVKRLPA